MHIHGPSWISPRKGTFFFFFDQKPHYINTVFRDTRQFSIFFPCLFPCHQPRKDKVQRTFFNLMSSNWWEKVVPFFSALSWRELIRFNDQINGEFCVKTYGDWMVWRKWCCYISLHSSPWLRQWWKEKQGTKELDVDAVGGGGGRQRRMLFLGHGGERTQSKVCGQCKG